ncbi:OmpP1/FadL family transporter [Lunatibacter salilacus]|uniref:OmpP1/FadL family transporter n=1 Tax=Lunatibacter salilacus TaxID=2483804 RepID=UPI00131DDCFD|nr:long-chain fatty acid transporter [Lunatibacter salilacus]
MKAVKSIIPLFAFLFITSFALAQSGYVEDALRFSMFNPTGAARISGLGGTQHSLGGDISNIHGNPAGLGFFQRSEFNITAGYTDWNAETVFLNQGSNYNATNFHVPNIGVVISRAKAPLQAGDWRGGSFGFSFNRQSNFRTNSGYFSNQLGQESILDYYIDQYSQSGVPGGLDGLFYDAFLINPVDGGGYEYSPNTTDQLEKFELVESEGNQNQISFAYGGNYKNKLFLGANLGIVTMNFRRVQIYSEEFLNNNQTTLFSSLDQNLLLEGSGVNIGVGAIYKPIDQLNIGVTFHSPTWSRINEEFLAGISAEFTPPYQDPEFGTINQERVDTDLYISSFSLRSPMRLGSGLTYFFGKNGFLSADVDYLDYSMMNLRSNVFNAGEDNREIRALYGQTFNYRVGGEARIDMLRIRAGYSYIGDPFLNPGDFDRSMTQLSGGLGVKLANFSVDLAVMSNRFNSFYTSYPTSPLAITDNQRISGMLSFGFSF